ncbi:MAG: hypothetical protein P8M25_18355 [Paracoccaceae bacterium]|nr:hypothetical protein [Paracoccaceae bacterium]
MACTDIAVGGAVCFLESGALDCGVCRFGYLRGACTEPRRGDGIDLYEKMRGVRSAPQGRLQAAAAPRFDGTAPVPRL